MLCATRELHPTLPDTPATMSETFYVTMEDQSSKCSRPEMTKMDSTPRKSSKHWQDHDVLHKVYHTGISTSQHKAQNHVTWQKHSGKNLPQNLFFEGFKDCASEVIRFLTEVEKVEDNNPLVKGLQSHLVNVSKAICQESFIDLDHFDNSEAQQAKELRLPKDLNVKSTRTLPDSDCTVYNEFSVDCSSSAQHMPCAISPIVMRSANNSVSDTSYCESDMSTSYSSNITCQSISSELSTSLHNSSAELNPDSSLEYYIKNDDVFQCPSPQQILGLYPNAPILNKNTVLSLKQLASMAVHKETVKPLENHSVLLAETNFTEQSCVPARETAIYRHQDDCNQSPMQYLLPLGQSSPVLARSQSHSSSMNSFFSHGPTPNTIRHPFILPESSSPLALQTDTFSEFHPITNRAFLSLDHAPSLEERREAPLPTSVECRTEPPQLAADISQNFGSILELQANFLPGIDTSAVASGSFADILLAVESCRFHEEPRVRALADELIHLIHDDYSDEDDDNDTDAEDHEDETNRNDESGIEMMDESSDWGNPVDMIEQ
ncbi:unnamed protein product [Lymnaea stagnalis]|uniref:Orange domain-containing protein n=1 Tax=Lymnaea stagnalis TaxID=6523 RepID=A0AAV2HVZ7_LYMST